MLYLYNDEVRTNTGGYTKRYPTVSFEGAFAINYYFTPNEAAAGEMTFYYWSADAYAQAEVLTAENASGAVTMAATEDGRYWAQISGIAAKELDETLYVAAFYEAEGETYCSGVLAYSLAHYCKTHAGNAASDMNAFANAAAIYGCAAKSYFAQ